MLVPVTSVETRMLGCFSPAMMRLGEGDNGDDGAYFGILSTKPIRLIRLPAPSYTYLICRCPDEESVIKSIMASAIHFRLEYIITSIVR